MKTRSRDGSAHAVQEALPASPNVSLVPPLPSMTRRRSRGSRPGPRIWKPCAQPVARMKRLVVCDLFDDGVLLFDRHPWCSSAAVRCHFQVRGDELSLDGPSDETQDVFTGDGLLGS